MAAKRKKLHLLGCPGATVVGKDKELAIGSHNFAKGRHHLILLCHVGLMPAVRTSFASAAHATPSPFAAGTFQELATCVHQEEGSPRLDPSNPLHFVVEVLL